MGFYASLAGGWQSACGASGSSLGHLSRLSSPPGHQHSISRWNCLSHVHACLVLAMFDADIEKSSRSRMPHDTIWLPFGHRLGSRRNRSQGTVKNQ